MSYFDLWSRGELPKLIWNLLGLRSISSRQVIAIDSSLEQLNAATKGDNVTYRKGLAEETGVEDHTVDLVTVAQALHWCASLPHYALLKLDIMTRSAIVVKHSVALHLRYSCQPDREEHKARLAWPAIGVIDLTNPWGLNLIWLKHNLPANPDLNE
jgi:hypothetical protein